HEKEHDHDDHGHEKSAAHEGEHDHDKDHDHEKKHDHDDHGHEKSAAHEGEHDHDKDHDHEKEHGHDDHDEHGHGHGDHGETDPHVWLDPQNAKVMVEEIKRALSEVDPANAALYASNAEALAARLDDLSGTLATELGQVKDKPFVVFHDAYHYFEDRFGLEAAGSITVNPEVAPGAARIAELRDKLNDLGATCVFSEPQFSASIVEVLTEETKAATAVLDPLGAKIEKGPDLYFELVTNMARSFKECLSS
ncbi:MAG: zinc ABC transporter substrate-binding protein, partial [Hyphomicrobiales bacterium]